MPLHFYSALIAAMVALLAIWGLRDLGGILVIGPPGALLALLTWGITHLALMLFLEHRETQRYASENRARTLIGLPPR